MKFSSTLPLSAIFALSLISVLVNFNMIPSGLGMLESLQSNYADYFFLLIFTIILLESIVYVGFYFPGQFFAVVLVVLSEPSGVDMLNLTVAMVAAATLGSLINYLLGRLASNPSEVSGEISLKHLLLAMIHMNSLAFFMFAQGANKRPVKVVWLAGLLNLPYYLVLIVVTATLSDKIMQVAESTWLVFSILGVWLMVAAILDFRKYKLARL
jgi:membrane-associated protein